MISASKRDITDNREEELTKINQENLPNSSMSVSRFKEPSTRDESRPIPKPGIMKFRIMKAKRKFYKPQIELSRFVTCTQVINKN